MFEKIINSIKNFKKSEKIIIGIWTFFNFLFLLVLLFAAKANIISALVFFIFWELLIFIYYLVKVRKDNKSKVREWADAILFAVIAATLIKSIALEAYTIPTPSMEKSLMVGDFLFVSKINYGPRIPMTPVSFPFVHNTLPGSKTAKSFIEIFQLPYYRLPGFEEVDRQDVVVFNYPGDADNNKDRPVDKRDNYIKRCVAIPGDTVSVVNGVVKVMDQFYPLADNGMRFRMIKTKENKVISESTLKAIGLPTDSYIGQYGIYSIYNTSDLHAEKLKNLEVVDSVYDYLTEGSSSDFFPNNEKIQWNPDNFGPLYLPKKGDKIRLTETNYILYERAIRLYENNPDLTFKDGKAYINNTIVEEYEFQLDYYFMMGDNRHNSSDSRFWGMVPHTHIVGKAVFVWLSLDYSKKGFFEKIRWNKLFTPIK